MKGALEARFTLYTPEARPTYSPAIPAPLGTPGSGGLPTARATWLESDCSLHTRGWSLEDGVGAQQDELLPARGDGPQRWASSRSPRSCSPGHRRLQGRAGRSGRIRAGTGTSRWLARLPVDADRDPRARRAGDVVHLGLFSPHRPVAACADHARSLRQARPSLMAVTQGAPARHVAHATVCPIQLRYAASPADSFGFVCVMPGPFDRRRGSSGDTSAQWGRTPGVVARRGRGRRCWSAERRTRHTPHRAAVSPTAWRDPVTQLLPWASLPRSRTVDTADRR